jgi:hypothetical protein
MTTSMGISPTLQAQLSPITFPPLSAYHLHFLSIYVLSPIPSSLLSHPIPFLLPLPIMSATSNP